MDGPSEPKPEEVLGWRRSPGVLLIDPVFDRHRFPTPGPARTAAAALPAGAAAPSRALAAELAASADLQGAAEKGWVGVREWAAGFVLAQRSGHTRRAYVGDLQHFLGWCVQVGLAPGRVARADLDRYARVLELTSSERTGRPLSTASRARRLAVVAGLYRYAAQQLGWASSPAAHLARPRVGSETPLGPSRVEVAALLAAAEADSPRAAALVSLLVHTGLRIDEALSRDVAHWRRDAGHEVLELHRMVEAARGPRRRRGWWRGRRARRRPAHHAARRRRPATLVQTSSTTPSWKSTASASGAADGGARRDARRAWIAAPGPPGRGAR